MSISPYNYTQCNSTWTCLIATEENLLVNPTSEQSQNSADEMDSKEAASIENVIEVNLPDKKLINTTTEQSQNNAVVMGRSRGQPDKKLVNPTTVQSHKSAADRGYAKGAAKMPPGSIDLFASDYT